VTALEKPPAGGFSFAPRGSRFVRTVYLARAYSFAFCFATIAALLWQRNAGTGTWVFLALTFLAYPQIAYLTARSARVPRRAEQLNLLLDSLLLGIWAAELAYPLWISYAMFSGILLNNLVIRGVRGLLWSLVVFAIATLAWGGMRGFAFQPDAGPLATVMGLAGALGYACTVGAIVYRQTRRLVLAREELRMSEERYRLITENAGDLICMVDAEGRWRYVSPSYVRLLPAEDVLIGTDAFRRVFPADSARARSALRRMLETGADEQFNVRLVRADGQVRAFECAGHPVRDTAGAWTRAVLVSRDVTELQASREQLEVAALAFANMTEAIMISSADGRVVSVNKAFCRITGLQADEVVGQAEAQFRFAMQPASYYDELYAEVARDGHWAGSTWSRRKDGSVYHEWRTVSAVRDEQERVVYHVAVFFEMDANKRFATA
jgi:PAS domain S-box-containing protein